MEQSQGATGLVAFSVKVAGQAGAPTPGNNVAAQLEVKPIAYGPHVQPGGTSIGVCIYLGARILPGAASPLANSMTNPNNGRQQSSKTPTGPSRYQAGSPATSDASSRAKNTYNWVQRVHASDASDKDECEIDPEGWFVDNCPPGNPPPGFPQDPSYAKNSNFYRNGNADKFTGAKNPTWINPDDGKPYDYIFLDIPGRNPTYLGSDGMKWEADLNPVLEGTKCAEGHGVTKHGDRQVKPYCTLTANTAVHYGFSLAKINHPIMARNPQGTYYSMHLEPLMIGGIPVAKGGNYVVQVNGNVTISQEYWSFILLPKTIENRNNTDDMCTYDHIRDKTDNKTAPLPSEPAKFQGEFKQF